jgi:hypothetical protein
MTEIKEAVDDFVHSAGEARRDDEGELPRRRVARGLMTLPRAAALDGGTLY